MCFKYILEQSLVTLKNNMNQISIDKTPKFYFVTNNVNSSQIKLFTTIVSK